ncbi:uncharacterized protein LOC136758244 [Amia ocellicauda]|uniref:uncharacterized protein LOC136758244 n=1 Tax=Amia ocellicauda TaxID=2972642 RepID=UPI0034643972
MCIHKHTGHGYKTQLISSTDHFGQVVCLGYSLDRRFYFYFICAFINVRVLQVLQHHKHLKETQREVSLYCQQQETGNFFTSTKKGTPVEMLLQRVQMESEEEGTRRPIRVAVDVRYRLGERSETRLQELGLHSARELTVEDVYYDNEDFQLAAQQTWLSTRDGQWRLIVGQGPHVDLNNTNKKESHGSRAGSVVSQGASCAPPPQVSRAGGDVRQPAESKGGGGAQSLEEHEGTLSAAPGGSSGPLQEKRRVPAAPPASDPQPAPSNMAHSSSCNPDVGPELLHCELTTNRLIVELLAGCLQFPLTGEEQKNMTMEKFVELAGLQPYGSWTATKKLQYRLRDACTLVTEKDFAYSPARHTAVLSMQVDVLDIMSELGKIERIAMELELEPLA